MYKKRKGIKRLKMLNVHSGFRGRNSTFRVENSVFLVAKGGVLFVTVHLVSGFGLSRGCRLL